VCKPWRKKLLPNVLALPRRLNSGGVMYSMPFPFIQMQTTNELPSECPVRVVTGRYKDREGITISLPEPDGYSWVQLHPQRKGQRPPQLKFTRAQLADLRQQQVLKMAA
jgi:hypothetical protein